MKKMLILLNHQIDDVQVKALAELGFEPEYMTDDEKKVWSQIKPESLVRDVQAILDNHKFDDCLVQGHFGAVGYVLKTVGFDHCWYAHSIRDAVETKQADGSSVRTSVFRFAGYIKY